MKYLVCATYVRNNTNIRDFIIITESPEEELRELHAKYITSSYDALKGIYIVPISSTQQFESFNNYNTAIAEIKREYSKVCDNAKLIGVNFNESN